MIKRIIMLIILLTPLTGCSYLLPFESESACALEGNYGQCISGEEAYEEAVTGEKIYGNYIGDDGVTKERPGSESEKRKGIFSGVFSDDEKEDGSNSEEALNLSDDKFSHVKNKRFIHLKDSVYEKLKGLVDNEKTPMVRPVKVVSTLILNYQSQGDRTNMYMPRMVYSILKEPEFIMNQYMLENEETSLDILNIK